MRKPTTIKVKKMLQTIDKTLIKLNSNRKIQMVKMKTCLFMRHLCRIRTSSPKNNQRSKTILARMILVWKISKITIATSVKKLKRVEKILLYSKANNYKEKIQINVIPQTVIIMDKTLTKVKDSKILSIGQ